MSRVHHDDEGRVFYRDREGQVWRVMVRARDGDGDPGADAGSRPPGWIEFRRSGVESRELPLAGTWRLDELSDRDIESLFQRARSRL
jgi:hypothetical protein